MKSKSVLITLFAFFLSINSFSQIAEIDPLLEDTIAYMKGEGYKFIEGIEGDLNSEYGISFEHSNFVRGHGYKIVSFYTRCEECLPSVQLLERSKDTPELLGLELEFSDTPYRKAETSFFLQYQDKRGTLSLFSNSGKPFYIYSLLFFN